MDRLYRRWVIKTAREYAVSQRHSECVRVLDEPHEAAEEWKREAIAALEAVQNGEDRSWMQSRRY